MNSSFCLARYRVPLSTRSFSERCLDLQLSVKDAFPSLWEAVKRGNGSIVRGMMMSPAKPTVTLVDNYELGDVQELMKGVSVYSFRDGMSTLTKAIETALERNENVEIIKSDGAAAVIRKSSQEGIVVSNIHQMIVHCTQLNVHPDS